MQPVDPESPLDNELENREWTDSLDYVIQSAGPERAADLLARLQDHARRQRVHLPFSAGTPLVNSIPVQDQPPYPGNRETERRIKSIIRWNAMAMVVRANKEEPGIGGHISTYASAATLYEVGFNHFFRGKGKDREGDIVFFQGHASPGIYARAYLEGRISETHLENFRHDLRESGGLTSYPHPWLMPEFWEFPTVSMGLGPIMAIYQARFNRYLEDRGLKKNTARVWAFLGDGETDEPEALGAITLASREKLDNLTFVINCNLQRLDGPVRGNGQIIQELEAAFRGAGWNVVKVVWSSDWDPLFAQDHDGLLRRRLSEIVDGEYQKLSTEGGAYVRQRVFGGDPRLLKMVEHLSDDQLARMKRGGHDPEKVYAAYHTAVNHKGAPTVVLAMTVKGYGLGEAGEGKNITHQQKKLNENELMEFRTRFGIPLSDEHVAKMPFYAPPADSPLIKYLKERREKLGGFVPQRIGECPRLKTPGDKDFAEFAKGTDGREVSTTMVFVRILTNLLKDKDVGRRVVPIVPDEARTFGMESLFRQCGIYSHVGQLYEPVDAQSLLYYKEATDGQIFEEGITEAGAMSSFIAAATSYATHNETTIPFYIYYSMFGFQRIGDLAWAAADMRARGFMLGGTSGRTTLAGEGLQHQDGNSHIQALPIPNLMCYDPAYAFELAVIIQDGLKRMYEHQEDIFYYITVLNENYAHPPMPEGAREGILKGLYLFRAAENPGAKARVQLFGSGAIFNEALAAADLLRAYDVEADVWSVTSYKELRREALEVERHNRFHPADKPREAWITRCLKDQPGPVIAASDYISALPDLVARWVPGGMVSLGTDGFGRSEGRAALRDFFEVDRRWIALAALTELHRQKKVRITAVNKLVKDLELDLGRPSPVTR
jgi:pyruvate dehydrogenase E1 component